MCRVTAPRLVLDEFLPYRLSYTANLVSETVARAYKALFGLTIPEWRLIAHTAASGRAGVTQQDIVGLTRMDKVAVSRAAIALANRGLIRRKPNAADKRSQLLALTPAGRQLYAQIAPKALELEQAIFGGFSDEERRALKAILRQVDEATLRLDVGEDNGGPPTGGSD
jgi:DNA-binding MarR family transcriptional regulator